MGQTASYVGPFVIDRTHPLCEGLSLEAAIWSCPAKLKLTGTPVITAGNVVLMSDRIEARRPPSPANGNDRRDVELARAGRLADPVYEPGAMASGGDAGRDDAERAAGSDRNGQLAAGGERSGAGARRRPGADAGGARPAGERRGRPRRSLHGPRGRNSYRFSCNAVSRDESDLRGAASGRWGNWNDSPDHQDRRISLRWAFGLLALAAMGGHLAAVAADSRRREA